MGPVKQFLLGASPAIVAGGVGARVICGSPIPVSGGHCWLLAGTSTGTLARKLHLISVWSCYFSHSTVPKFQNERPNRTEWNLYGLSCPRLGNSIASHGITVPAKIQGEKQNLHALWESVNITQEEIYWMGSPITAILENTVCILLNYRAGLCLDCSLKANFLHLFQLYSPFGNFVSLALWMVPSQTFSDIYAVWQVKAGVIPCQRRKKKIEFNF